MHHAVLRAGRDVHERFFVGQSRVCAVREVAHLFGVREFGVELLEARFPVGGKGWVVVEGGEESVFIDVGVGVCRGWSGGERGVEEGGDGGVEGGHCWWGRGLVRGLIQTALVWSGRIGLEESSRSLLRIHSTFHLYRA